MTPRILIINVVQSDAFMRSESPLKSYTELTIYMAFQLHVGGPFINMMVNGLYSKNRNGSYYLLSTCYTPDTLWGTLYSFLSFSLSPDEEMSLYIRVLMLREVTLLRPFNS